MKRAFFITLLCFISLSAIEAQDLSNPAVFHSGDDLEWVSPFFDDSQWASVDISNDGFERLGGFAWYRIHLNFSKTLFEGVDQEDFFRLEIPRADGSVEVYFNGKKLLKSGSMPTDSSDYTFIWNGDMFCDVDSRLVNWNGDNILAFRVFNDKANRGLYGRGVSVSVSDRSDGIDFYYKETFGKGKEATCEITLENTSPAVQEGVLEIQTLDPEADAVLGSYKKLISVSEGGKVAFPIEYDGSKMTVLKAVFTDSKSGTARTVTHPLKYILTPETPSAPRFNGASLYGVRPGSPVIWRLPVSGERPMKFFCRNLPSGLTLDSENGVISGSLSRKGDRSFTVTAKNSKGKADRTLTIRAGDSIALTPPMGWSSWNCWGSAVTQERVLAAAQALLDKGLADYGYCYVNIDDSWEAPERDADGKISSNDRLPDIKGIGDFLHSRGLKFGIYSSPGDLTCGRFLGSLGHEEQDAETFSGWGVDYLKYDWCGYSRELAKEANPGVSSYIRPYLLMGGYLRELPRDIFYSLCQYGMADVWEWGASVGANSWRTTEDVFDNWDSLFKTGFESQMEAQPYAGPGHWNDPDMLVVGRVGWSETQQDSRLTSDEQYTQISLWALLAANLLIGCDVERMDEFTLGLLCNNEVVAVDQDTLGVEAVQEVREGDVRVFRRPLSDGSSAIGIFNVGDSDLRVDFSEYYESLGIDLLRTVRDLWRQKALDPADVEWFIPSHGAMLIKVTY